MLVVDIFAHRAVSSTKSQYLSLTPLVGAFHSYNISAMMTDFRCALDSPMRNYIWSSLLVTNNWMKALRSSMLPERSSIPSVVNITLTLAFKLKRISANVRIDIYSCYWESPLRCIWSISCSRWFYFWTANHSNATESIVDSQILCQSEFRSNSLSTNIIVLWMYYTTHHSFNNVKSYEQPNRLDLFIF